MALESLDRKDVRVYIINCCRDLKSLFFQSLEEVQMDTIMLSRTFLGTPEQSSSTLISLMFGMLQSQRESDALVKQFVSHIDYLTKIPFYSNWRLGS